MVEQIFLNANQMIRMVQKIILKQKTIKYVFK